MKYQNRAIEGQVAVQNSRVITYKKKMNEMRLNITCNNHIHTHTQTQKCKYTTSHHARMVDWDGVFVMKIFSQKEKKTQKMPTKIIVFTLLCFVGLQQFVVHGVLFCYFFSRKRLIARTVYIHEYLATELTGFLCIVSLLMDVVMHHTNVHITLSLTSFCYLLLLLFYSTLADNACPMWINHCMLTCLYSNVAKEMKKKRLNMRITLKSSHVCMYMFTALFTCV